MEAAFFLLGGEVAGTVWYLSLPVGSEIYKEW